MIFVFISLFIAAIIIIIAVRSKPLNGERSVGGKLPLEEKTIKAEEFCDSFDLPAGSVRLNTHIISKSDLGVVTNEYSTDLHCLDADLFFREYLSKSGWNILGTERKSFLFFWPEIHATYGRGEFSAYIDCKEMKDYRGIRYLTVGCGWGE